MKKILGFILILNLSLFCQNITNTLGSLGVFKIKDGTNEYFTLSQSNGNAVFLKNIELGNITNSTSTSGMITKNGERFIHNYQAPGTSGLNIFIGLSSGNFTMSGTGNNASLNTAVGYLTLNSLTTGQENSAFGFAALASNTTGVLNGAFGIGALNTNTTGFGNTAMGNRSMQYNSTGDYNSATGTYSLYNNTSGALNSAFGYGTLYNNTTGAQNSAFGYQSLYFNTGNYNSGFGSLTLFNNTTGNFSSAFGFQSLQANTTGAGNSAFGYRSLASNTTANSNTAFGFLSLNENTIGFDNSAFGHQSLVHNNGSLNSSFGNSSLFNNTTGIQNCAFGSTAGTGITTGSNNITIGYNAQVPTGTSSNQIRLGNTFITYAGIQVAWTITSDRRLKSNILDTKLGLNFISKLRPVSYIRKNDESQKTEFGLIAQEVEQVLKQEGAENSGMLTITDEGMYELRYNDLIAPMIKAIQELKAENDKMKKEIETLKKDKISEK